MTVTMTGCPPELAATVAAAASAASRRGRCRCGETVLAIVERPGAWMSLRCPRCRPARAGERVAGLIRMGGR